MNFTEDPFQITAEERQHFLITSEIANALNDIVWIAQPDGRINYYNRHWFNYTGMSLEKATGAGWVSVVHPNDMQSCVERWTTALVTGEPYQNEFRLLRSDGTYRWHLGQGMPVRNAQGQIIKWFGVCRDIEDHVRTQNTILDSYEKHKLKLFARIAELEVANARLVRENMQLKLDASG